MKLAQAMRLVLNNVRTHAKRNIIPSIRGIQKYLHSLLGMTDDTYVGDINTYMTLLYLVYLLLFMLHYKMPLQRKTNLVTEMLPVLCIVSKADGGMRTYPPKNKRF